MNRLKYLWLDRRYLLNRRYEAFVRWIVWRLPRELVMWCYIRVAAHATTGKYANTTVPDLSMMDALQRWEKASDG